MFTLFGLPQSGKRIALFVPALLTLVLVSAVPLAYGSTTIPKRYVSPTGTDMNNNCLTSSNPCKTINHALSVASPGDELRLTGGGYVENVVISKNITIEGASLSDTFIDGGLGGRVMAISPGVTATLSELFIENGTLTGAEGAGLSNAGTLTLKHVMVANNTTTGGNTANDNGGGIWNTGTLTIESSYISNNHADGNGGGIYSQTGTLTIESSTVSANTAGQHGGGIENNAASTLTHTNVAYNSAQYDGGGIDDSAGTMSLVNVTISGNSTTDGNGGGVWQHSTNPITLTNVTFRNNSAPIEEGGGLLNQGNATLTDVTFDNNFAASGGGMANLGAGANATLTNVTFSGNGADAGGGLFNYNGVATLTNVTFSGNWVPRNPLGGAIFNYGTLNLKNTIIANSPSGGNCDNAAGSTLIDSGYNIDSGVGCGLSTAKHDLIGIDALLGPLQNNGGYTDTFALLKGSPAINKGTNTGCPKTDQRGKTRITSTDPTCDIGAYEYP